MSNEVNEQNEQPTEQKGLSRRAFLRNSGLIAAAAGSATVLGACGPQVAPAVTPEATAEGGAAAASALSWATPPAPIADADIVETIEAEVVVVGAGFAGVTAALSAAENGAKVAVIEKGASWSGRGGGIGVFSSRIMREQGIDLSKSEIAREWIEMCGNRAKESLVWTFLNESGNAMDWWLDKAEPYGLFGMIWGGYYHGTNYSEYPCYHMFFGGVMEEGKDPGANLAYVCYEESLKQDVTYYFEAPAEQLIKDGDRVVGVIAKTADGYKKFTATKGVVLATGDIGGNDEMCKDLAPLVFEANGSDYYPIGQNTGDGHRMGLWAGGALQDTPFPTMIHPQAFSWKQYPILFVNRQGKRFMNEDNWVQARSLQIMQQPGGLWAYSIFDSKWQEYMPTIIENGGGMFVDTFRAYGAEWSAEEDKATVDGYLEAGEWAWKADTLEELAELIDVPAENLLAEVERINALAEAGEDVDFGKRPELLYPIKEGPFYALKFGPQLLTVVGGLTIDTKMRVLDDDQNPVPGLYAVGNVSGSVYGQDYPIQVPGNSHGRCLTWGYLAGKSINEEAQD